MMQDVWLENVGHCATVIVTANGASDILHYLMGEGGMSKTRIASRIRLHGY